MTFSKDYRDNKENCPKCGAELRGRLMELELRLADELDIQAGWCIDPACLEKIKAEYHDRNGALQVADLEFIDDILSIVWEAGLLRVSE